MEKEQVITPQKLLLIYDEKNNCTTRRNRKFKTIFPKKCNPSSNWRKIGIRESVLNDFESEMLQRAAIKVKDSAEAAHFLHSEIVLLEEDRPRGRCISQKQNL